MEEQVVAQSSLFSLSLTNKFTHSQSQVDPPSVVLSF